VAISRAWKRPALQRSKSTADGFMKLTYKLFSAFLLTSLLIVSLMVFIMQYYASRNFSVYVGQMELEQLSDIRPRLEQEYREHQGWAHARGNNAVWAEILHLRDDLENRASRTPPPPKRRIAAEEPPPAIPAPPPHDVRPRLTLFDLGKQVVVGAGTKAEDHALEEIRVDGKLVGWLGLRLPQRMSDPLQLDFLYRQTKILYLIGGAILILAALVAYFLARQMLRPVRQLAHAAQALGSRQFDTRIEVRSSDELGQLSADFNRMASTLDRYERLRRQWISDLSHELRTPLSVLTAEVDATLDGVRDMRRETLESIQAQVLLMTKLVDDLHMLSLLDSNALPMEQREIDILKVVRDILQAFELKFAQAAIAVQADLESKSELIVRGDRMRLGQVFSNIAENTLKYTTAPGKLHVSYGVTGKSVRLIFDDSPPAVSHDELPNIFERLYRTDRSRSTAGSGLGLAISKAIIEAAGGTIQAGDSPLGGLRIEITLPLA
jgi:two-component system sensor histidine kinase BaeS